jgi:oligopeptidase A
MEAPIRTIPTPDQLPLLDNIHDRPILSELNALLEASRRALKELIEKIEQCQPACPVCWHYFQQLETIEAAVSEFWAPIDYIHSVDTNEALGEQHKAGLVLVTEWHTALAQNKQLHRWMASLRKHSDWPQLSSAQRQLITYALRGFALAGVGLPEETQKRIQELQIQLVAAEARFEDNIVSSSQEQALFIQDEFELAGLSSHVIRAAATGAQQRGETGWLLPLNGPTYRSVMTHAESRTLREAFYRAWATRASETTNFDNSALMYQMLTKRYELSQHTQNPQTPGFLHNYAERSLAENKMAETPEAVMDFLSRLIQPARLKAEQELQELQTFANQQGHSGSLCDWDLAYFSEKLKQVTFGIQEEELRAYFPLPHVLAGLFDILKVQFGLYIEELKHFTSWDPAVKLLAISDQAQQVRGYLYLDLYARPQKRPGAWVCPYIQRRLREDNTLQLPIAFLSCNFAAPVENEEALLTHSDVVTLFHEMGHALHHTLTQVNYAGVSGMAGVPWDAVELPSQLLQEFPWEPAVLARISRHYQTGETLPQDRMQALGQSHYFQAGLSLIRQLEFSLFDFQLHLEFDPTQGPEQIQQLLDLIRKKTRIIPAPSFNRFQHSFSHIFGGGYAAGFYSYLWAEVLAADAFEKFLEEGLQDGQFNLKTGHEFMASILESGGAEDMLTLFKQFRGRKPDANAFLRRRGILPTEVA